MRRCGLIILLATPLLLGSCTSLQQEPPERTDLIPLSELPAEYGQLVAVTQYGNPATRPGWYELWFSAPDSGRVTHVPVHRRSWSYDPEAVRVIERH